ncbi:MAG: DUF4179 domain-containing protein [Lachnospiraceae bacterium]|nr:DUF4179 domain-containing protein [Lachnospiraceae bacterium]
MSMKREAYRLANEFQTDFSADQDQLMDSPDDMEMKRYEANALREIRKEKRAAKGSIGKITAAACIAAALLAGTVMFRQEVHASIRQITWSISSALGLSEDLAAYRDVLNSSVSDKGYVVTLQEAVVSEEKLTVNYTIQREDGQPIEDYLTPDEQLFVNGKQVMGGAGGSSGFLDEEQTIIGAEMSYQIPGVDMSQENEFCIKIHKLGFQNGIKGKWDFAFTADGAALMADTKRISMEKSFTLPDGVTVTLKELTMNELEQRISFTQSGSTRYMAEVLAVDDTGRQVKFGLRSADEKSGYLSNEEYMEDGRIADTAAKVVMTLYVTALPEEDGQIIDEPKQVGEPFELKL